MRPVYINTTSRAKSRQFAAFFDGLGLRVEFLDIRTPEVQFIDVSSVSAEKLAHASRNTPCRPLIVDDTGISIAGLDGFPGALLKPILNAGGLALLDRLSQSVQVGGRVEAAYTCVLSCALTQGTITVIGKSEGGLDFMIRDTANDTTCERIFIQDGYVTPQLLTEGHIHLHRLRALQQLVSHPMWCDEFGAALPATEGLRDA
jgi:inosine/xanthosine triphosphate pyrophosphatase family protein